MATELPKQYDPRAAQQRWLAFWEERGYWHVRPDDAREPFCIVIPPPNVTGALHMGHALNNTLQDVLIRWKRMLGFNVLYMPGTDHAGIATQAVVEKRIRETEKKTRHDLGREELIKRIWAWKDQYEKRILGQLRELGCSCDWQRTRFTLDPICARAVRQTFFKMFSDGLIFRGKRLVNWDTQLQTSVANDETYEETIKGGFWTFKYAVKNTNEFIRFSTTRPETMLGDTAVCVHPSDERYQHLIGKTVTVPLVGREIPIIADALLADPKLGTGCVKVTPAHDPNDWECGQRNQLPMINILNPDGTINENGGKYAGLDRYKAREAVIADMEALGQFEGKEDRDIPMKFSDRSKSPIEPYLSDQWFVKMADLGQLAMDAVTSGRVKFTPERYASSYLDWLKEKRDWCISRQLWWGHRIPIWYTQRSEAELKKAFADRADVTWQRDDENGQYLVCALEDIDPQIVQALGLTQDPDVLDTWFSSALWPHSTLGWPEQTAELRYWYPTSVLITSRDIITLWVARMVLTGLYNLGQVPFHHVYIHPKILDGFGEGMSKSKGNGIDPLDIIECYGTDALRYQMVHTATENQDSRMPVANVCPHCKKLVPVKQEHMYMRTKKLPCPECKQPFRPGGPWPANDPELLTAHQASDKFELGRRFANKLWNAGTNFIVANLDGYQPEAIRPADLPIEDKWILSRLATTTAAITAHLENYRFSDYARTLYDFTWSEFCDWYVEMSKGRLKDAGSRPLAQRMLAGLLDAILRLAQPVMPFVAESIWEKLNEAAFERGLPSPQPATESVVIASWPSFPASWQDPAMEERIARMQELIRGVREVRNRYNIDSRNPLELSVRCAPNIAEDFTLLAPFIQQLAGISKLDCGPTVQKPKQAATHVTAAFESYVSLAGFIDPVKEAARLEKELALKRKSIQGIEGKLGNASFVKNAPPEVVAQQREQLTELAGQIQTLEANLRELAG